MNVKLLLVTFLLFNLTTSGQSGRLRTPPSENQPSTGTASQGKGGERPVPQRTTATPNIRLGKLTTGRCAVLSPDGRTVALTRRPSVTQGGSIYLVNIQSGKERKLGDNPTNTDFASLAFSPDGKTLASGGGDLTVRLWNISTGQMKVVKKLGAYEGRVYVAFSPGGTKLVTSTDRGENVVTVWSLPATVPKVVGKFFGGVNLTFLNESTLLIGHGRLMRFDLTTGESETIGKLNGEGVGSLTISPEKNYVVSTGGAGARLWNLQTRETRVLLPFLPNDGGRISQVALSPDGKTLVTVGDSLFLWDFKALLSHGRIQNVHDFAILPFQRIPTSRVDSVSFSPDGQWLLVRDSMETVSLLASNREQLGSESSPNKGVSPVVDVKRTGERTWRVVLPPRDWYETGLPVISGITFRIESDQKILVRVNNKLEASGEPIGRNPLTNGPGPLAPAIAYPSRGDAYYLYATLCDRCRLLGDRGVAPDFIETLKLKTYDNKSDKPLELLVVMDFKECADYKSGDNLHRELHDKAKKEFQNLLGRMPYK